MEKTRAGDIFTPKIEVGVVAGEQVFQGVLPDMDPSTLNFEASVTVVDDQHCSVGLVNDETAVSSEQHPLLGFQEALAELRK